MSQFPDSWVECEIGEISPVIGGGTPPSKDPRSFATEGGVPWITPADLSGYGEVYISRGARDLTEHGFANSSAKLLPKNALLFSSRAPVGYVAIAANPVCTNQGFKSFVLPDGFDPRYGYYYLRHIKPLAEERATGTTFKELSGAAAALLPFLVAPLPEQKRIADKLEAVLGRVDSCRARLVRVPDLLKRFRQSVLAAATSGRLTENPEMKNWTQVPFEDLLADKRKLSYGVLKPGDNDPSGVAMYRIVDIGEWGKGCDTKPSYISKALSQEFERTVIEKGDILLSVMATIGRAMVATDQMIGSNVNRAIAVIKPDSKKVNSHYLNYYFLSPSLVREFEERSIGSAQVRINLTDLRLFTINLPPLGEQQEIVRRIQVLFSFADRIEARLNEAQSKVDRLTPSTLTKAFRGKLVPQDPTDEPASALLERIRRERDAQSSAKRTTKRRIGNAFPRAPKQKSIMTKSRFDEDVKGKAYLAGLLRNSQAPINAEALFKLSELPLVDFYKQLAWEVQKGHIRDDRAKLEAAL